MNTSLEKFKFTTLKNVHIRIDENENSIDIKIEPVNIEGVSNKPLKIQYVPFDRYDKGEFMLTDNHKKIEIERWYAIPTPDDIDWDCETIYPK